MERRAWMVVTILIAIVAVVAVLVVPRSVSEAPAFDLTSTQSPAWTVQYCIPEGTQFTFQWAAAGGTVDRLTVQSPFPNREDAGYQTNDGANGSGRYYSDGVMQFQATGLSSDAVVVSLVLSFTLTTTYLWGTPHSGPAAC
jgi:hypothetical protein